MESKLDLIRRHPLFEGCDTKVIEPWLQARIHRLRTKPKGVIIFEKDERCSHLILLLKGQVLAKMDNGKNKYVVNTFEAPNTLAPYLIYCTKNDFPVYAKAETECLLFLIEPEEFSDLMARDHRLTMNFIALVSSCGQHLSRRLYASTFLSLRERTLDYLHGHELCHNTDELATYFGVSRPSISRIVATLRAEGLIVKMGNTIRLATDDERQEHAGRYKGSKHHKPSTDRKGDKDR